MKKMICIALVVISLMGVLAGCCCPGGSFMEYECQNCGGTFTGFPKSYYMSYLGKSYDVCSDCYDYLEGLFG